MFTISSYNMGCLKGDFDYMMASSMEQLMQERYQAEPKEMALLERIEIVAAKRFFGKDQAANREWEEQGYDALLAKLTAPTTEDGSMNRVWYQKLQEMVTDYRTYPVRILDESVAKMLQEDVGGVSEEAISKARHVMDRRIFSRELTSDILCLQEADRWVPDLMPQHYANATSAHEKSANRIVWNAKRFELIEKLGDMADGKGFGVLLRDQTTQKTIAVATAHLKGCNPFVQVGNDSKGGDAQLRTIVGLLEKAKADIQIVGMDSNVTATHPRLQMLLQAGYVLDTEYLDPTCPSPYFIYNTRLDWIAVKGAGVDNVPVANVGLNNHLTNPSDHRPIAARVHAIAEGIFA